MINILKFTSRASGRISGSSTVYTLHISNNRVNEYGDKFPSSLLNFLYDKMPGVWLTSLS